MFFDELWHPWYDFDRFVVACVGSFLGALHALRESADCHDSSESNGMFLNHPNDVWIRRHERLVGCSLKGVASHKCPCIGFRIDSEARRKFIEIGAPFPEIPGEVENAIELGRANTDGSCVELRLEFWIRVVKGEVIGVPFSTIRIEGHPWGFGNVLQEFVPLFCGWKESLPIEF